MVCSLEGSNWVVDLNQCHHLGTWGYLGLVSYFDLSLLVLATSPVGEELAVAELVVVVAVAKTAAAVAVAAEVLVAGLQSPLKIKTFCQ